MRPRHLRLKPGVDPRVAAQTLDELINEGRNVIASVAGGTGIGPGALPLAEAYVRWLEGVETHLQVLTFDFGVLDALQTGSLLADSPAPRGTHLADSACSSRDRSADQLARGLARRSPAADRPRRRCARGSNGPRYECAAGIRPAGADRLDRGDPESSSAACHSSKGRRRSSMS